MWRAIRMGLLAATVFAVAMALLIVPVMYFLQELEIGIYLSVGAGFVFGLTMAWISYRAAQHFDSRIELFTGETLLHQGPANHYVDNEAVGGWVYLTNKRILFVSHNLNYFIHNWEAPLSEVVGVSLCKTMKVIPNGLVLHTTQGDRTYVVEKRKRWQREINKALKSYADMKLKEPASSLPSRHV